MKILERFLTGQLDVDRQGEKPRFTPIMKQILSIQELLNTAMPLLE